MKLEPTEEHVSSVMKFLRDTLTEERTDTLIAFVKVKFGKFVPWFARPFVWRYLDQAVPGAILEPLEVVLMSRVYDEG
jgi:hypothetical protein